MKNVLFDDAAEEARAKAHSAESVLRVGMAEIKYLEQIGLLNQVTYPALDIQSAIDDTFARREV